MTTTTLVRVPATTRPATAPDVELEIGFDVRLIRCDICGDREGVCLDAARPAVLCWRCSRRHAG